MSIFGSYVSDSALVIRIGESASPCRTHQRTLQSPESDTSKLNQSPVQSSSTRPSIEKNLKRTLSMQPDPTMQTNTQVKDSPDSGVGLEDDVISSCSDVTGCFESEATTFGVDDDSLDGFISTNLDFEEVVHTPARFQSLIEAPLVTTTPDTTDDEVYTIRRPACTRLSRRFDSLHIRAKRPSPARQEGESPEMKKRREIRISQRSYSLELPASNKNPLKRCQSANDAIIKAALDRVHNDPLLISDGSKSFSLPTIPGKHQDLTSITPETLACLMNNEFSDVIEQYFIIDCRYPFEYNGGHIQGAMNYFTKEAVMENLLTSPIQSADRQKRTILIFHCEFSSERAPKLSRFLRSMDREQNKECYPELHYPEVYLLHGGYKNFFESQQELCTPQGYVPMLHADHKDDLRTFRAKWKSWPGEKKSRFSLF